MFFRHVKRMVTPARTLFFSSGVASYYAATSFNRPIAVSHPEDKAQDAKQAIILQREQYLNAFLQEVDIMMRKEAKLRNRNRPVSQVFFSYAWEPQGSTSLKEQQDFLERIGVHLQTAGLSVWLDIWNMNGAIDPAMRDGINESQFIVLLGMPRYKERVSEPTTTNVRKELNLALKKIESDKDCLLPILWKGDWGSSLPKEIPEGYLVRDWRNSEQYVENLTSLSPLGLLPAALGLNKQEEYHKACREEYKKRLETLTLQLKDLKEPSPGLPSPPPVTGIVELKDGVVAEQDLEVIGVDAEGPTGPIKGTVKVEGKAESKGNMSFVGVKMRQ